MNAQFPRDYWAARERFRQAAAALGCAREAHPLQARGPRGEELTIDVAVTAGADSRRTLIISSGIHGVEGFLGSAIQCALLEEWATAPPPVRCVLLHALNPFGFAWRRRVNEQNVDVNRNLLLDGEAFAGSAKLYSELDSLLNPKHAPSRWRPLAPGLIAALARHGMPALKQALASGQYDYPQGLFYGGAGPAPTNSILSAHLQRWVGAATQVLHIDFHTGLGRWGTFKLLTDQRLSKAQSARLGQWFGAGAIQAVGAEGVAAYSARGTLGRWAAAHNPGRDYLFIAPEFGTYSVVQVLAGLRAENQAHHWCDPADAAVETAKQRLVELFCPQSGPWRHQTLQAGLRIVAQAIAGLAARPSI